MTLLEIINNITTLKRDMQLAGMSGDVQKLTDYSNEISKLLIKLRNIDDKLTNMGYEVRA